MAGKFDFHGITWWSAKTTGGNFTMPIEWASEETVGETVGRRHGAEEQWRSEANYLHAVGPLWHESVCLLVFRLNCHEKNSPFKSLHMHIFDAVSRWNCGNCRKCSLAKKYERTQKTRRSSTLAHSSTCTEHRQRKTARTRPERDDDDV